MSNIEKECKWHFDKSGISLTGPNDSIHETFRANPYYSIVREAIQNSIDAVDNEQAPVKVVFEFGSLKKELYPNLFDIKKHILACWQYHKGDVQAQNHFHPMSNYISKHEEITFLKISDYNTKGMRYEKGDVNCPFISFVRAEGKSAKQTGAGGSFGFGKGAYYVLSQIKTILVSTKTVDGNLYFEGKTRLATHEIDGELLTRDGYYTGEYGSPVISSKNIPEAFIRNKTGTDIYIVGLIKEEDKKKEMVKSVLNNFWLAIHHEKLEIEIVEDDEVISITKNTLENLIEEYFLVGYESGSPTNISGWNPKAYYKSVKNANLNDNYRLISKSLETLGEVSLYVYLEKGLPNRVAYFRKPRMVVQKKTKNKLSGYVAVLLCDNAEGNELLRQMENAAHNEWKPENYRDGDDLTNNRIYAAHNELSKFVNDELEALSKVDTSKKINFLELEEHLAIPEDLLEKDDDADLRGENANSFSGTQSKETSELETGLQTTEKKEPVIIKASVRKKSDVKEDQNVIPAEDGEIDIATGGDGGEGGDKPPGPGDKKNKGAISVGQANSKVLKKVKLKVAAQNEKGLIMHNLLIHSDEPIINGELELLVSGDNDRDDSLGIVFTDMGTIESNTLTGVSLNKGITRIKVQFEDNLKYSVKIKAYELK